MTWRRRAWPWPWPWAAVAAAVAVAVLAGCAQRAPGRPAAARLLTITIPAPRGELASTWLSYAGPPRAEVLLPAGYDPHRRYPLVVFLNGLDFDYDSYARYGLTAPFDHQGAIVVMPEGGNGWYTDWWNDGTRGDPSWESYELDTVIPAVLARYPVLPERGEHALIGISMGGLGAVYLGGRLPGFFGSVATLSGFVDTGLNGAALQPTMALFSQAALKGDDDPDPVDGPPGGFYAAGHDPALLVGNLAHTRVFETTGTGVPSRAEPRPTQFETLEERSVIYPMNERYHRALVAAHVDVTYQVHTGNHDIPDFLAEIRAMLAWGLFEPVVAEPVSWTDRTVATTGQLWDLDYRFAAPPTRVVTFHQRGTTLTISAAGSAVTITTGAGCAIHSATPATVHLPDRTPVSPRRPEAVARRPCR